MKISILHTSARPDQWRNTYEAWIAAAAHPQNVEYILCADERWGFADSDPLWAEWLARDFMGSGNRLAWNTAPYKHSGYVSGVNEAAKHSTGDVLVVIADDFFPCQHWDEEIIWALYPVHLGGREAVIWVPTNTPKEFERNIMVAPILTRSRYERLGYVLYPKYESMYADNDFAEHAQFDQEEGRCVIIRGTFAFDHKHPFFHPEQMDDVYRAQNHPDAYEWGKRILEGRRAAQFGEVAEAHVQRRTIALLAAGETFSRRWLIGWTDLIGEWAAIHDVQISFPWNTNVHLTRAAAAKNILELENQPEYVLWIDDDNPPFGQWASQLLRDLEAYPEVGMVAGWCLTETGQPSFGTIVDGKRLDADLEAFKRGPELQRIYWTGFPMVLMRYSLLKDVGYRAFLPQQEGEESDWEKHIGFGFIGEDLGFCKRAIEKGHVLLVDRRVKLEHLKLQDVVLPAGEAEREPAATSAETVRAHGQLLAGLDEFLSTSELPVPRFGLSSRDYVQQKFHVPPSLKGGKLCSSPGCLLEMNHPGSCYPGPANAAPAAEPGAPEASQ
jgi:hypothetical protein